MLEQALQSQLFTQGKEKTFIDKILAKEDNEKIRELVKKNTLTRSDLLELLYLLSSVESKLLNYGEWDRYVILKFFVWIREFVKVSELLYDYQDEQKKKTKHLSERAKKLFENNQRLFEHNVKFLVDLYLNIGRTTLSLKGSGFMELLNNKFELAYPQANQNNLIPQQQSSWRGILGGRQN